MVANGIKWYGKQMVNGIALVSLSALNCIIISISGIVEEKNYLAHILHPRPLTHHDLVSDQLFN